MFRQTVIAAIGVLLTATVSAMGQNYPTRPITMVIPFAAGGPTDVLGRIVGQRMSEIFGQQVVIENAGGAGGRPVRTRGQCRTGRLQHRARYGRHARAGSDALQEAVVQFDH